MTIIQETHGLETPLEAGASGSRANAGSDGTFFQTYEMLPDGAVGTLATAEAAAVATTVGRTAVTGEQRINPEFEHFLQQFTNLLKQLHQVSNPENILQACTVLQRLKVGTILI